MKKIVFILFFIIVFITKEKENIYIIPNEAIRFRIIANSNSIDDQSKKVKIKNDLEKEIKLLFKDVNNYEEANSILATNIGKIENIIKNETDSYSINLGMNYFPEKIYKKVKYPEGNYNSLVVTLGKGLGNNWWCVLYPPLCFIDEEKIDKTEYHFFIKEMFNKIN